MAGRKSDFTLTKLDDLFSTQEQRDEEKLSKIRDIPLTEIDDFPDHPFKVRDDEDMAQLIERAELLGAIRLPNDTFKGNAGTEVVSDILFDIIARAEDASKIQRIVERFELGKVDKAAIVTESQKAVEKREALEKDKPTKTKNEIITEEAVRKPIQKEGYSQSNPTVAKTDKNPPSRHDSEPVDMQTDKGTVSDRQRKPSVKAKLDRYKAQSKQQKEAERKEPEVSKPEVKNAPAQTVHQQPKPKSKNVKER